MKNNLFAQLANEKLSFSEAYLSRSRKCKSGTIK